MDTSMLNMKLDVMLKNADDEYKRLNDIARNLYHYADIITATRVGLFILRDQIKALKEEIKDDGEE